MNLPMNKYQISEYAANHNLAQVKLNLGCGGRPLKGWINIDNFDYEKNDSSRSGSAYDIKMDIRELACANESVDEILLVHVLEHFVRWETVKMIGHYFTKLKPGGSLIVEMPDLDKCIELYLKGKKAPHMKTPIGPRNMGHTQFHGNQWDELDYETHRYVWTAAEFVDTLKDLGFEISHSSWDAKFHQKGRDMFVIARKPC